MNAKVGEIYQHYKGGIYTVLHIAEHTETNELFVIYHNESGKVWARPKEWDPYLGTYKVVRNDCTKYGL